MKILSLGAGVQSSAILLLSCEGILPKLDCAIFADTGWEPPDVYKHLEWLESQAKNSGIPIYRVSNGNVREGALTQITGDKSKGKRWGSMPFHTLNPDGTAGIVRRQCTSEYKITPVEKFIRRELLGIRKGGRVAKGTVIDQWFGISADEPHRIRDSPDAWRRFCYPLIGLPDNYLDKPWRRWDCVNWLQNKYPDRVVPRSSCIGCPFHSDHEWRRLRDEHPQSFADAVEIDNKIRKLHGMNAETFLHSSRKPLSQIDLDKDTNQLDLFGNDCSGFCGV
jgi:hypothetical protein